MAVDVLAPKNKLGLQVPPFKYAGKKPRFIVFLIHGIAGDATTFPNLDKAIELYLNRIRPEYNNEVVLVTYDTGGKGPVPVRDKDGKIRVHKKTGRIVTTLQDKTSYRFAAEFGAEVNRYFIAGTPIREGDKISIIMHSQGGLVGSQWIFNAFLQTIIPRKFGVPDFFPQYVKHLDAAITLGTPFWGTKQAVWVEGIKDRIISDVKVNAAELHDLMFTCTKVLDFRRGAIRINEANESHGLDRDIFKYIRENVRILNIGGFIPIEKITRGASILRERQNQMRSTVGIASAGPYLWDFLKILGINIGRSVLPYTTIGLGELESDGAVGIPSSRYDFMYYVDRKLGQEYAPVVRTQFRETNLGEFTVLPALHVNPAFPHPHKLFDLQSLAQVPDECLIDINCDHPTLKMVVEHLLKDPISSFGDGYLKKMTAFSIAVNIRVPKSDSITTSDMFEFEWETPRNTYIDRTFELGSKISQTIDDEANLVPRYGKTEAGKKHHRFVFSGAIDKSDSYDIYEERKFRTKVIKLTIRAPGFVSRRFEIPVRSTFSTFLDIEMDERPWIADDWTRYHAQTMDRNE